MRTRMILSLIAAALMLVSLSACDDDPAGSGATPDTEAADAGTLTDISAVSDSDTLQPPEDGGNAAVDTSAADTNATERDLSSAEDTSAADTLAVDMTAEDVPVYADVPVEPDVPEETCDNAAILDTLWNAVDQVSDGEVTSEQNGDVHTLTIDASAGGSMQASAFNPYIYVNLLDGVKVAVDDISMMESSEWHLALKRSSIITNGGAQLAGSVRVANAGNADFDLLDEIPSWVEWREEDFVDEAWCEPLTSAIGGPAMAVGEPPDGLWYDYDSTSHAFVPRPRVYLLQIGTPDGDVTIKLKIDTAKDDGVSGVFSIRWALLGS